MASWSLCTVAVGSEERVAILREDGMLVQPPAAASGTGVMALMERWDAVREALEGFEPAAAEPLEGARLLAPLRYPRKLICAGANYGDHLAEMKVDPPAGEIVPFFFLLPPTTTIVGSGAPIAIPPDPAWRVDWEAELAVVIGRGGRGITAAEAPGHVAGWCPFNDISARGRHRRPDPLAPPFAFDWLGSKGSDGFCPMGPGITPSWLVADPHALAIRCWRNGRLEQDGNTRDMLNDSFRLIEAISAFVTLEPGDVIATGTPAGVGAGKGAQLAPGDDVAVEIEGLGRLENRVVEAPRERA